MSSCFQNSEKCSAAAQVGNRLATIDRSLKLGVGAVPLFEGGAGSPCNTMWPGTRPTFVPSGILVHPAVWSNETCAENWGGLPLPKGGTGCAPFGRGAASPSNTMWPGPKPVSVPTGVLIDPFGHNRHMDRKCGLYPLLRDGLSDSVLHLTQCGLGRGLPPYQVAS